jgi:superfamily II DNA or RNA helicase
LIRLGYDVDISDKRKQEPLEFEPVTEDEFVFYKNDKEIRLRDYQLEAVNIALQNHCGIFEMATGSGKTFTCASIAKKYKEFGRVLVIVPTTGLVSQTAKGFRELGLDCGEYCGDKKTMGDVIVSTWQTLNNYRELFSDTICVICDEAHRAKADILFDIMTNAGKDVPHRFGFTGTLPKEELYEKQLIAAIGERLYYIGSKELQDRGDLAQCHIDVVQFQDPRKKVFDDYIEENKFIMNDEFRLKQTADLIRDLSKTGNTIAIINNIDPGKKLAKYISDDTVFISGKMKADKRQEYYDAMTKDSNKVYVCIKSAFATGTDIPELNNLVFYEIGKSYETTIQAIGRVIRLGEEKDTSKIYDVCSNTKYSKVHLRERKKHYKEKEYPFTITKVPLNVDT